MTLSFRDVGYTYDSGTRFATPALSGLDLDLGMQGLTLILGATGSGKSTLLRLAAGLLMPTAGAITYDGAPVTGPLADKPRPVGLVFQSPESQLFAESVEADVSFAPRNRGANEEDAVRIARDALASVGLEPAEFAERSPFSLSGGEARRVAIAGVLAMGPGLLLFDEPTAGLDAQGRAAVRDIVLGARERVAVVVVTHDAEEFLGIADDVLLLDEGEAVFDGPAGELIAAPERFAEAGLRAPEVLRAQVLLAEAGSPVSTFAMDPIEAAAGIVRAREVGR